MDIAYYISPNQFPDYVGQDEGADVIIEDARDAASKAKALATSYNMPAVVVEEWLHNRWHDRLDVKLGSFAVNA